jgi:tRNA U38,U39,U40 pseudouridine synthase TruA
VILNFLRFTRENITQFQAAAKAMMASHTPAKRQYNEAFSEENGYLSSVTPVKTFQKINRYFNAKFQTESKEYRVVSFNVGKHKDFMKADALGSPVKITNFRLSSGDLDLIVNRYSKIEHLQKLKFKRKIVFDKDKESDSDNQEAQFTAIEDVDFSVTHKSVSTN